MAKKPDGMGTLNTTPGSCVDVPCTPNLTVIYRVRSSCGSLPYALEVNGKIPEAFKNRALGVKCDGKSEIKHPAKPGDRFALYLNSDAHPDFRQQKVYAITVGDNDLVVTITEKTGKHADSDAPKLAETQVVRNAQGAERTIDFYTAPLTGDIWMKISHKYTVAEVNAMLPSTTGNAECEAVRKFYDGSLNKKNCAIDVVRPAQSDSPARQTRIIVGTGADTNPLANIQSFELFRDGLPRVHPLLKTGERRGSNPAEMEGLPDSRINVFDEKFHLIYEGTDIPMANQPYKITASNGAEFFGITDDHGFTDRIRTDEAVSLSVEILASEQPAVIGDAIG